MHMKRAVGLAIADNTGSGAAAAKLPATMGVFSGGQSRASAGPRSEGGTYLDVVIRNPTDFGLTEQTGRTAVGSEPTGYPFAEEHARDSLENVLFSLCRFYEITGRWPRRITVVGFAYKARRFVEFHRLAQQPAVERQQFAGRQAVPCRIEADHVGEQKARRVAQAAVAVGAAVQDFV